MKIILSVDPVHFPLTGIGRYTYELARCLPDVADDIDVRYLAFASVKSMLPWIQKDPQPEQGSGAKEGILSFGSFYQSLYYRLPGAGYVYRSTLSILQKRTLKHYRDCIYHGPNFYLPDFVGPKVVTFHDLSVYKWAHCHPRERVRVLRKYIQLAVKHADLILTDSDFTRHEVSEFLNISLDRIRSIPLASSGEFRPRSEDEVEPVLTALGLKYQQYILFAGTIEPRKNIGALLDAYEKLPDALRLEYPLVLCGFSGWHSNELHRRIQQGVAKGWLKYPGFVAAEDLPALYAGARLFVFPSHYEGFGLPVLEAMASGVPVVCSDSSSLPEVAGDAALMFNTKAPRELSALVQKGLEDEAWRMQARQAGLEQSARFSWQLCAQQTYDAYKSLT